jgi:pimeloyl-ACP methyl ester carboxylesterase
MIITTADSHKISVRHLRQSGDIAIIVAHGFYTNKDTHLFKEIEKMLHRHFDVFSFDFRGHGLSGGFFSWTTHEAHDLHAVISFAEQQGYKKIGLIGFSLGAAAALIESSQHPNPHIKSIIAVSTPAEFWKINYRFWMPDMLNEIKAMLGLHGKGKGARWGSPFLPKTKPIDIVHQIAPTPLLFLHGREDWLIKHSHSEKLFKVAKEPKELHVMAGAGHAERMFAKHPDEFERLCVEWFKKTIR